MLTCSGHSRQSALAASSTAYHFQAGRCHAFRASKAVTTILDGTSSLVEEWRLVTRYSADTSKLVEPPTPTKLLKRRFSVAGSQLYGIQFSCYSPCTYVHTFKIKYMWVQCKCKIECESLTVVSSQKETLVCSIKLYLNWGKGSYQ